MAAFAAMSTALAQPALAKSRAPACVRATPVQLDAQFAAFNNAWATKNPATVTALFATDAILLPTLSNTPRTDPASIRDYFVSFLKNSPAGTINTSTIKSGCNWALRAGTWTVNLTDAAIFGLSRLPPVHRDPFDRLLIVQAKLTGSTLVSPDKIFSKYPVTVIW